MYYDEDSREIIVSEACVLPDDLLFVVPVGTVVEYGSGADRYAG